MITAVIVILGLIVVMIALPGLMNIAKWALFIILGLYLLKFIIPQVGKVMSSFEENIKNRKSKNFNKRYPKKNKRNGGDVEWE